MTKPLEISLHDYILNKYEFNEPQTKVSKLAIIINIIIFTIAILQNFI